MTICFWEAEGAVYKYLSEHSEARNTCRKLFNAKKKKKKLLSHERHVENLSTYY